MYKLMFKGEKILEFGTIEEAGKEAFDLLMKQYPPIQIFEDEGEKPIAEVTFQAIVKWMGPMSKIVRPGQGIPGIPGIGRG